MNTSDAKNGRALPASRLKSASRQALCNKAKALVRRDIRLSLRTTTEPESGTYRDLTVCLGVSEY
jgi:hypothetical protein